MATNWQLTASKQWAAATRPGDLAIVGSGNLVPYLRYSGWRNVVYLPQFMRDNPDLGEIPKLLEERIEQTLQQGDAVYLTSDAGTIYDFYAEPMRVAGKALFEQMLARCQWQEAFSYSLGETEEIVVYQLVSRSCQFNYP